MSTKDPKAFLGIGWKFPVLLNISSKIAESRYEQDIQEAIWIILETSKGERVMLPEFGCGIHNFVFESINSSAIARMKSSIQEDLRRWEPRIQVINVDLSIDDIDRGKIVIEIIYLVRATNNQFNIVYPFFLKEGL